MCRPGLVLWPCFSSWTRCCCVTRKSYLHKPLPTSSSTLPSAQGQPGSWFRFHGIPRTCTAAVLHISRNADVFLICPIPGLQWVAAMIGLPHTSMRLYIFARRASSAPTRLGLPGCHAASLLCSALLSCVIYANVKYFEMPLPCERKQTEVHYKVSLHRRPPPSLSSLPIPLRQMLFGQPTNRIVP